MEQEHITGSLLGAYRGLDLTDEKGLLCGKILADLGAQVIKIEPPQGDLARKTGPFYQDIPNPDRSLYWFSYNVDGRASRSFLIYFTACDVCSNYIHREILPICLRFLVD